MIVNENGVCGVIGCMSFAHIRRGKESDRGSEREREEGECVSVCVCVCARGRERERKTDR